MTKEDTKRSTGLKLGSQFKVVSNEFDSPKNEKEKPVVNEYTNKEFDFKGSFYESVKPMTNQSKQQVSSLQNSKSQNTLSKELKLEQGPYLTSSPRF